MRQPHKQRVREAKEPEAGRADARAIAEVARILRGRRRRLDAAARRRGRQPEPPASQD